MSGCSSHLVNCKQLQVAREVSKWACLFSCAHWSRKYCWAPAWSQEQASPKGRTGEHDTLLRPGFWNMALFWSNVSDLNLRNVLELINIQLKARWEYSLLEGIWLGLNNVKNCPMHGEKDTTRTMWWVLECSCSCWDLETFQSHGIQCDFSARAACCQLCWRWWECREQKAPRRTSPDLSSRGHGGKINWPLVEHPWRQAFFLKANLDFRS